MHGLSDTMAWMRKYIPIHYVGGVFVGCKSFIDEYPLCLKYLLVFVREKYISVLFCKMTTTYFRGGVTKAPFVKIYTYRHIMGQASVQLSRPTLKLNC